MPKLPSGKRLALSGDAILVHDGNWFTCPDGHFWYERPDTKISPPPYGPDSVIIQDFVHAPIPQSRKEAMRYIRVLHAEEQGEYYWRGVWLSDYLSPSDLDRDDARAWQRWLRSSSVVKFIDYVIGMCGDQAKQNRKNTGMAFFHCLMAPAAATDKKYPLLESRAIDDWIIDGHEKIRKGKYGRAKKTAAVLIIPQRRMKPKAEKPDLDEEDELLDLFDTIIERGALVLSREWDSGGPGAGAGQDSVYWYNDKYWLYSNDFDDAGPYEDINELIKDYELLTVSEATTEIYCPHIPAKKLAGFLKWRDKFIKGFELVINGQTWSCDKHGSFQRTLTRR